MIRCGSIRVACVLVVLLVTGCVKIDSTMDVAADGSGTWRVVYAMPVHMIRQIETTRDMVKELDRSGQGVKRSLSNRTADLPYLFDESAVRERFKALDSQGIMLTKLQTRSQGGWRYVDFTVKFTRLETLINQPFFDPCGFSVSGAGTATCKLVVSLPDMGPPGDLPNLDDATVSARVTPFMNGLRVTARIGVPGEIRNSNSSSSDGKRAVWEWDFDNDARVLARLAQEKIVMVFDGTGVRLRDFTKTAARE